MTVKPSARCE